MATHFTIVVEGVAPGGQAGTSSKIENYLGFPTGISQQTNLLALNAAIEAARAAHRTGRDRGGAATKILANSQSATQVSRDMADAAGRQREAVDMVSTAFHEMVATSAMAAGNEPATPYNPAQPLDIAKVVSVTNTATASNDFAIHRRHLAGHMQPAIRFDRAGERTGLATYSGATSAVTSNAHGCFT